MNRRSYLLAAVDAEVRAKLAIARYSKEFETNGNPNQRGNGAPTGQTNNAQGNVPQRQSAPVQPAQYGG
jgi:hypothetical protein